MPVKPKRLAFYARLPGLEKQLHPMHLETNQQRLLYLCLVHTTLKFQSLSGVVLFSQMPLAEPFPRQNESLCLEVPVLELIPQTAMMKIYQLTDHASASSYPMNVCRGGSMVFRAATLSGSADTPSGPIK